MKKIFLVIVIILTLLIPTGCGNKQIFDFNYEFNKAYIKIGEEWVDLEIKSWKDYEDGEQLQIILHDGTVLLTNSFNCILYTGTLPK